MRGSELCSHRKFDNSVIRWKSRLIIRGLEVELNRLSDVCKRFVLGLSLTNASWKRRDVCGEATVFASFQNNLQCHTRHLGPDSLTRQPRTCPDPKMLRPKSMATKRRLSTRSLTLAS